MIKPGFWCPSCVIGWLEHDAPNCRQPLDHFREWINSARPAEQPSHSTTLADTRG
jgi:hypothetical protein